LNVTSGAHVNYSYHVIIEILIGISVLVSDNKRSQLEQVIFTMFGQGSPVPA